MNSLSPSASYKNLSSTDEEEESEVTDLVVLTPEESQALQNAVNAAVKDLFHESKLFVDSSKTLSPPILQKPLPLGEKLGEGGFCQVFAFEEPSEEDEDVGRAIKFPLPCHDSQQRNVGSADLVREAHFLSVLQHDNIIAIHGMGSYTSDNMEDFFVVLERVEETLGDLTRGSPISSKSDLLKRLQWGLQIARALQYMHSKHVIYRDLKLSNVGLDENGVIKLFDFGLAKELKASNEDSGKYRLSGKTGSYRTMAPEVAKGWRYNEKVDVYSFGIVLWEILSGEVSFAKMSEDQHLTMVANGQERPNLKEEWPSEVKDLLQRCWSFFPNARPSMLVVESGLSFMVSQVQVELDREHEQRTRMWRRAAVVVILICLICWYWVLRHTSISYRQ